MHFLVSWFVETGNGNSVTTQKAQGYRYILWVWWRKLLAGGRDIRWTGLNGNWELKLKSSCNLRILHGEE